MVTVISRIKCLTLVTERSNSRMDIVVVGGRGGEDEEGEAVEGKVSKEDGICVGIL